MTYEIIKDPYCTGDRWYKQYELIEEKEDSKEILEYLMSNGYIDIPKELEYDVDGDAGKLTFTIYPEDMLSYEDQMIFLKEMSEDEAD